MVNSSGAEQIRVDKGSLAVAAAARESAEIGYLLADCRGKILSANSIALKLLDARTIDALLRNLHGFELYGPDGLRVPTSDGPLQLALRGKTISHREYRVRRFGKPDSTARFSTEILRNSSDEVESILITLTEVAGQAHAESRAAEHDHQSNELTNSEETHRSAEILRAIVEASPLGILALDDAGRVTLWNRAAQRILNLPPDFKVGSPPPFNLDLELQNAPRDLRLTAADGRPIDLLWSLAPMQSAGGPEIGYVAVFSDITERKRAQREMVHLQRMESLGVLAGGLAHDFNNLLTGILGNASLALYSIETGSPIQPLLEEVMNAGERAALLTKQLLAYAGKTRLERTPVNLNQIASEAVRSSQSSIDPEAVSFHLDLASGLPAIEGDAAQLQQVLANLIVNAMESFDAEKDGEIVLRTRRESVAHSHHRKFDAGDVLPPGDYVVIEVSDNGSGMDEDTCARVFEPFFSTKFTGRGLGLSAVLGIVRQHNGALSVETGPGTGTAVSLFLPAAARKAAIAEIPDGEPGAKGAGFVLVIDDEHAVRETIRRALERLRFRVVLAENGQTGVEIFPSVADHVRAIILDLTMPVMSGEEALKHLQRVRPDVPVILTSGYPEAEAMRRMRNTSVAAFLQKPFTAEQIGRCLRDVIAEAEKADSVSA